MIAGASTLLASPAVHAQTAGVALVVGNSKYQWEAQLPNVRRDAPDIAKRFQAMGMKTELLQDVGRDALRQAVDKFGVAARGAHLAAFYFAGHGATWGRETYLVPVDADLSTPSTVQTLLPVSAVQTAAAEAAHRLMILDACRNNPADGWRQVESQRNAVFSENRGGPHPPNTLLMFSTAPGRVALDGPPGQNSPFAAALMRQLDAPKVDFSTLSGNLRRDLLIATEGRQVLFDRNSIQSAIALRGARLADATNNSSWARDHSKIMDLAGAYAFARENKFILPEGLIAHRLPAGSREAQMVGSYKYWSKYRVGTMPHVMIVMSAEHGQTVELILAGISEIGPFWRFVSGQLVDGRLEFLPRDGWKNVFTWRDANSGSMALMPGGAELGTPYITTFTRLDG